MRMNADLSSELGNLSSELGNLSSEMGHLSSGLENCHPRRGIVIRVGEFVVRVGECVIRVGECVVLVVECVVPSWGMYVHQSVGQSSAYRQVYWSHTS